MSHTDIIYDSDPHFTISPITRQIKNESSSKTTLVQGDHKSERFSFEMPRIIEGHDMSECNRIEIHYINSGISGESHKGIYDATDMHIHPDDSEKVVFSWLLWDCVTKYEGKLAFAIRFACVKNDIVEYEWNTIPNDKIKISKGIDNSSETTEDEEIPDLIAQWKEELFGDVEQLKKEVETLSNAGGTLFANSIKTTVSGKGGVFLVDASPLAHNIKVTVSNFQSVSPGNCLLILEHYWEGNTEGIPITKNGTYTMSLGENDARSNIWVENTTTQMSEDDCIITVEYNKDLNVITGNIETALDNIIEIQNNLMGVSE